MPTPLGAHNPQLGLVRDLLLKKGRREQGRFTIEGPTLLAEALAAGAAVEAVYAAPGALHFEAVARAEAAGVAVYQVEDRVLERLCDVQSPQGIVAVMPTNVLEARELLREPGLVALLCGISDPGNAGTLLRSAEAFGIGRVIFGQGSVEAQHPKVVRAAMGALFRLRLAAARPAELLPLLREGGWQVTGLDAAAEPLAGMGWSERSVIAVGAERSGLGAFEPLCTRKAALPMRGNAESLNAAVAGSLAFYEAAKSPVFNAN